MTEKQRFLKALEALPESSRAPARMRGDRMLIEHIDKVGYVSAPQMYRILRKALEHAAARVPAHDFRKGLRTGRDPQ